VYWFQLCSAIPKQFSRDAMELGWKELSWLLG
jgi:hypothetical protein